MKVLQRTSKVAVTGPMAGVRVLDLGAMIAGPAVASLLADQGALVIKVEPPGLGDVMRHLGATRRGVSGLFHACNRGKRSIALDLKSPEGIEIVGQLAAETDVVVHNFRPGVAERLGIDYAALKAVNPDLIYLSVSGFGPAGPYAQRPAYDGIIQAFSGVAVSQANKADGEPIPYYQLFCDKVSALTGAQAVSAALYARAIGRGGQHITLAMVDCACSFLWMDTAGTATFSGDDADAGMSVSGARLVRFADGWGAISPVTDSQFHGLCAAFEVDSSMPEAATVADRNANPRLMLGLLDRFREQAQQVPVDLAMTRLEAADVPCAKAMALADLPGHPQIEANGTFQTTEHPVAGSLIEPRNPPRFSGTPSGIGGPSPVLGEHGDAILMEVGFSAAHISELRRKGVVG